MAPELAASLDPALRTVLEAFDANGLRPLSAGDTVEQARSQFRMLTYEALQPEQRVPVASTEDIEVDGADGPIAARVYRPETAQPVPTIVFFHGGGFVIGDIDTHDNQCRTLCREVGAVVLSVDYRLSPEHLFTEAADDCEAATRWAAANIDRLGGDAARIAVAGDSAGGHCAADVAQALRDSGGPELAAQLLVYPAVDMRRDVERYPSMEENAEGYFLTREDMDWFASHYERGVDPESPRCSPILGDLHGLAPAVVVTAALDPLRDAGNAYARALEDAGVEVRHFCFDGLIHGFFGFGLVSPGCKAAIDETTAALRGVLSA